MFQDEIVDSIENEKNRMVMIKWNEKNWWKVIKKPVDRNLELGDGTQKHPNRALGGSLLIIPKISQKSLH